MEKPTESKGKVIIIPRPPRSSVEEWVPVQPREEIEAIEADVDDLGPQTVTGPDAPFGSLKGAAPAAPQGPEAAADEEVAAEEE